MGGAVVSERGIVALHKVRIQARELAAAVLSPRIGRLAPPVAGLHRLLDSLPALRQARGMVPLGWWRRRPFLPVPDRAWMRFRMETQYGDAAHRPAARDVVAWLEWARANARHAGGGRR